jgi:hypothetical protein
MTMFCFFNTMVWWWKVVSLCSWAVFLANVILVHTNMLGFYICLVHWVIHYHGHVHTALKFDSIKVRIEKKEMGLHLSPHHYNDTTSLCTCEELEQCSGW